jgi:hypothetical protein
MQNLQYPNMKYLINALTVKDFGMSTNTDPESGVALLKLLIKKTGHEIPWVAASTTLMNETTKDGAYKSVLVQVNAPAPCANCNYQYEINIHRKWQQPGNQNDDLYPTAKSFGGILESIQTPSGGFLADSDIATMETNIITQIEGDQLGFGSTREPNIVHAKRLYIMTTIADNTHVLSYTIAGVTATVTLNSGATALTQVNDINADATAGASLLAFALSTTQIAITSVNPGLIFTVADGGGATNFTGITRYMWIYSKYVDPKFYIDFKPFGWATVTPFNLLVLDNTSAAAGNSILYVNGLSSGNIANSATSITLAAHIVSSNIGTGGTAPNYVYASSKLTAGSVYVYVYSGANEVVVNSLGTAGVTVNTQYSGKGKWAALTSAQVFNIFLNYKGMDKLSQYVYLDQVNPASTVKYNKIVITSQTIRGSIHGASHQDAYTQTIEIYIAQGLGATSLWDATNWMWETAADGAFTADSSINALLFAWSGLTAGVLNDATHFISVV